MPFLIPDPRKEKNKRYRKEWMRQKRAQARRAANLPSRETLLLERGKCGICEMLLKSKYHYDCPGYEKYKNYPHT